MEFKVSKRYQLTRAGYPIAVLGLLIGLSASAANPTAVRLDKNGASMSQIPVRDQVGGTCYAYAAVGVADAWRKSHETKPSSLPLASGLAAAVGSGLRNYRNQIDGGLVCTVVSYLRSRGGCDQELIQELGEDGSSLSTLSKLIEMDHRVYLALRKQWEGNGNAVAEARSSALSTIQARLKTYGYPTESRPTTEELRIALDQTKPIEVTRVALVKHACASSRFEMKIPHCNIDLAMFWPDWMVKSRIDDLLTRKNAQPISMGFCANILVKGRAFNAEPFRLAAITGWNSAAPILDKDCGLHAALLIGKRENPLTGKVQYLIRNSWGPSCKYYSTEWTCEEGSIWVDADALIPSITGLAVLE